MKPSVILLLSTDPDVGRLAQQAATATRHGLRVLQSTPAAFRELEGCDDVALAVIDLDPGMHGAALLEAVGERLPVVVLTSLERDYMDPIARRRGARECLTKPFTAGQLQGALGRVLSVPQPA